MTPRAPTKTVGNRRTSAAAKGKKPSAARGAARKAPAKGAAAAAKPITEREPTRDVLRRAQPAGTTGGTRLPIAVTAALDAHRAEIERLVRDKTPRPKIAEAIRQLTNLRLGPKNLQGYLAATFPGLVVPPTRSAPRRKSPAKPAKAAKVAKRSRRAG